MAFDNTVTVVGNATRDPELRFTPGGAAVCNLTVAHNRKQRDGEEQVCFFDVTCWRDLAENVAASVSKGDRVVVYGRLDQRSWEGKDGERRSKVEIVADEVAPSLRWATSTVERVYKDSGGTQHEPGGRAVNEPPAYDPNEEPW